MINIKNKSLSYNKAVIKDFNNPSYYLNHIEFLRNNFRHLVEYKTKVGKLHPILTMVQKDLFDDDPFIVYSASLIATLAFADRNLYH